MPNMFERVSNYVKACLRCQQFRGKPDRVRPFHTRISDSYRPFGRISLDFKSMPTSGTGFKHMMVICDEITRFIICAPLKSLDAETICVALIQKVICIFGPPSCLVSDTAASLTGKLLTLLCNTLNIDKKVISVENHGSLHVERHVRTLSEFLKINLNQFGTLGTLHFDNLLCIQFILVPSSLQICCNSSNMLHVHITCLSHYIYHPRNRTTPTNY